MATLRDEIAEWRKALDDADAVNVEVVVDTVPSLRRLLDFTETAIETLEYYAKQSALGRFAQETLAKLDEEV